jgi:tripeptidyl-peptidase-1
MRSFILPFVLLSLGLAANADPTLSPWALHERRSHIPPGWARARKHDTSAAIPLRFALVQPNLENIEKYLYDVSHPNSPNYGKHWTASQVAATFGPSQESVDAVRDWLLENGIESSPRQDIAFERLAPVRGYGRGSRGPVAHHVPRLRTRDGSRARW